MKLKILASALAAMTLSMAATPLAAEAPAKASAPAARDWTKTVSDTPLGWRMGNPNARHKLVEYMSFNCGHCAALAAEKKTLFHALVKSGRMSLEYRPKTLFPTDPSATTLARCVAPSRRFAFIHDYMASQAGVRAGVNALRADAAKVRRLQAALDTDPKVYLTGVAEAGGMYAIAARHGLDRGKATACLTRPNAIDWSDARTADADAAGIDSTPTLFLDGKPLEADGLDELAARVAR